MQITAPAAAAAANLDASVILFLFAFVALKVFKLSPILILVISGTFGAIFYGFA